MSAAKPPRWLLAGLALGCLAFDGQALANAPKAAILLLVALAACSFTMSAVLRGERRNMTAPLALFSAAVAWLLVRSVIDSDPPPTSVMLLLAGVGTATVAVGLEPSVLKRLASDLAVIVGTATSLIVLGQFVVGAAVHGVHGNPNWAGLVLAAAIPFAFVRARTKPWMWLLLTLMMGALAVSRSRTSWLAVCVGMVVLARNKRRVLLAGSLIVAFAAGVWGTDLLASLAGRWWIWKASAKAATAAWWGHGPTGFSGAYLDAQGEMLRALPVDQAATQFLNATSAHHDGLHLAVQGGFLTAAALIGALLWGAYLLRDEWRVGSATLVVIVVSGLGDIALHQGFVVIVTGLILAAAPRLRPGPWRGLQLVLWLGCGFALSQAGPRWLAQRHLSRAATLLPSQRIDPLQRALQIDPASGSVMMTLGLAQIELGLHQVGLKTLQRARKKIADVSLDIAIGNSELTLNNPKGAAVAYQRALLHHPASFAGNLNAAEAFRRLKAFDDANRALDTARDLQPNHPKLRPLDERIKRDVVDQLTR